MKVIFLDIDGVLNSVRYDRLRTSTDGNIDVTRLELIKTLVDETGALLVLSSSWRKHWDKCRDKCDGRGKEIDDTFKACGLQIYDKTPYIDEKDRAAEVRQWLADHKDTVDGFVIFDDTFGGWKELEPHLAKTDPRIGRGLGENHINKARELLK